MFGKKSFYTIGKRHDVGRSGTSKGVHSSGSITHKETCFPLLKWLSFNSTKCNKYESLFTNKGMGCNSKPWKIVLLLSKMCSLGNNIKLTLIQILPLVQQQHRRRMHKFIAWTFLIQYNVFKSFPWIYYDSLQKCLSRIYYFLREFWIRVIFGWETKLCCGSITKKGFCDCCKMYKMDERGFKCL